MQRQAKEAEIPFKNEDREGSDDTSSFNSDHDAEDAASQSNSSSQLGTNKLGADLRLNAEDTESSESIDGVVEQEDDPQSSSAAQKQQQKKKDKDWKNKK